MAQLGLKVAASFQISDFDSGGLHINSINSLFSIGAFLRSRWTCGVSIDARGSLDLEAVTRHRSLGTYYIWRGKILLSLIVTGNTNWVSDITAGYQKKNSVDFPFTDNYSVCVVIRSPARVMRRDRVEVSTKHTHM